MTIQKLELCWVDYLIKCEYCNKDWIDHLELAYNRPTRVMFEQNVVRKIDTTCQLESPKLQLQRPTSSEGQHSTLDGGLDIPRI